jgi:hypothetical protein
VMGDEIWAYGYEVETKNNPHNGYQNRHSAVSPNIANTCLHRRGAHGLN